MVAGFELIRMTSIAFGAEGFAGLGAGVIEFACLADDDGAGADDQDAVEVVSSGHRRAPSCGPSILA